LGASVSYPSGRLPSPPPARYTQLSISIRRASGVQRSQGRTRPSRNDETAGNRTALNRYATGASGGGHRTATPYYAARQCPSGCVYNGCIAARLPATALGTRRWQRVTVTGLLPDDESCAHRGCAEHRGLHGEYLPARSWAILAILEYGTESDRAFMAESLLLLPGGGVGSGPGDGVRGCGLAWSNARRILNGRAQALTWAGSVPGRLDMEWWQSRWTAENWRGVLLERAESEQELRAIRRATYTGRPLGSKQFIAGLEEKLGLLEVRPGGRTKRNADRRADQLQFWNAE